MNVAALTVTGDDDTAAHSLSPDVLLTGYRVFDLPPYRDPFYELLLTSIRHNLDAKAWLTCRNAS
jgi:hypothetical protein